MEKTYAIDTVRLKNEIKKRGLSLAQASREIGYGDGALSNVIYYKKISNRIATALKAHFNIDYECYKPDTEENKEHTDGIVAVTPEGIFAASLDEIANKIKEKNLKAQKEKEIFPSYADDIDYMFIKKDNLVLGGISEDFFLKLQMAKIIYDYQYVRSGVHIYFKR